MGRPATRVLLGGQYAWPDPSTPDGLPYRRLDCVVNPDASGERYDWARMGRFVRECRVLVLASHLCPERRWLDALDRRLTTWFVDRATAMEPHLDHAAALPGVNDGMWVGIIEGACLVSLVQDLEALLGRHPALPDGLAAAIEGTRAWMARFAHWYRTSDKGLKDATATNNHGLWYHLQVLTWTRFADPGDPELPALRQRLRTVAAAQIGPDGGLPHELSRANALGYVVFTLLAVAAVAEDAERTDGSDLLALRAPAGARVGDAFGYLATRAAELRGEADDAGVPGRRAVLARWMRERLPEDPAVLRLDARWWPAATPEQRLRSALGLSDWR